MSKEEGMEYLGLVKDVVRTGLMEAQSKHEDTTQLLGMIQRFAELFPRCSGIQHVCEELVRIIIEETSFENCSIILWDPQDKTLTLSAAFGLEDLLNGGPSRRYHHNLSFASGEGIAGRVFNTHNPVYIENILEDGIPPKADAVVRPMAIACLPLLDLGVLNISSRTPYRFSQEFRRSWELLSRIVGYLILGSVLQEKFQAFGQPALKSGNGRPVSMEQTAPTSSVPPSPIASSSSGELSAQALERIPQGVCLLDCEGKVVHINKSIEALQGKSAGEMTGRSPAILFRDSHVFDALFQSVTVSDQDEVNDVSLVNASGEIYLADVCLIKLPGEAGGASGYLLVINDITKKKAFADKILQTEKLAALGTMAGGVAHDFNNLLMAILGNIQLVLPRLTDEEARRRLEGIEKAVHDGAHTVRRLQKFTERDKDSQNVIISADVTEAIRDVVELTRPRWKNGMQRHGHNVEFNMELEPHCRAAIHASDFREVLTNLLLNAVEAMPEGGSINIRSRCSGENVVVEVADSGIGMSEELAAKIFDPYYTTKGVGNSGLGLSVSWSLVIRHGGEIRVRSKPGKGSVFIIKLPKTEVLEEESLSATGTKKDRSHRILVVDDDTEVLGILRDMLLLKGHSVVATDEGEVALDLIDREDFDLILTDLGMPTVSGWDVAKRVKDKSPSVPVVLITGWGAQYEEEDLSKRGVDVVLSKPLSWEKLLSTIDSML